MTGGLVIVVGIGRDDAFPIGLGVDIATIVGNQDGAGPKMAGPPGAFFFLGRLALMLPWPVL